MPDDALGDALRAVGSPQEDIPEALAAVGNPHETMSDALDAVSGNEIVKVTWHNNRKGQYQEIRADESSTAIATPSGVSDRQAAQHRAEGLGFVLTSHPADDHLAEWSVGQPNPN